MCQCLVYLVADMCQWLVYLLAYMCQWLVYLVADMCQWLVNLLADMCQWLVYVLACMCQWLMYLLAHTCQSCFHRFFLDMTPRHWVIGSRSFQRVYCPNNQESRSLTPWISRPLKRRHCIPSKLQAPNTQ